ncbi:hypothetical protein [Pseudomonas chlororaphis]|uniref:hypothetical protein n=1 Tax=Pseudomonas chlororaphis TaxID=587753 RepID=UPI00047274FD|nr:hypothetical protein [Pseudomonas chlororaphis]
MTINPRATAHSCFAPFHEGQHIEIGDGADWNTADLVRLAFEGSLALEGRPVRCTGVVPGVSMRVTAGTFESFDQGHMAELFDDIWSQLRPLLAEWLSEPMFAQPAVINLSQEQNARIVFAWDITGRLRPGVLDVHVHHDAATAASYAQYRRHYPLVEHAPDETAQRRQRQIAIRRLLVTALDKSRRTGDARYSRLPVHVRYRITGAQAAWQALQDERRLQSGEPARKSESSFISITRLVRDAVTFTRELLPNGLLDCPLKHLVSAASQSAVWSAFETRGGQFYEPSLALHRLLNEAYIADDVPIGALSLPMATLCIVPEASSWGRADVAEAIVLFRNERQISCAAWSRVQVGGRLSAIGFDVVELSLEDPDKTIRELLTSLYGQLERSDDELVVPVASAGSSKKFWQRTLDYAIKMLLYLSVRDAHVVPHREYSQAPREFPGLGRRKRAERLEAIEQLYDRYVVGPAVLDEELAPFSSSQGALYEVRSHWRRPHFKMQRHGPKGAMRKLVFIGPTIVRADRLSS